MSASRHPVSAPVAALLAMLAAAACAPDDRMPPVASCGGPADSVVLRGEDRPTASAVIETEEDLRIGTVLDGDGPQFGLVTSVTVDEEGRIYVADAQAHRIQVFGADGSSSGSLGSEGEGPGEFRGILRAEHGTGDSLFVFDLSLWRQVVFDPSGRAARTTAFPPRPQFGQKPRIAQDEDGRVHHLGFGTFRESVLEALDGRAEGVVRGQNDLGMWSKGGSHRRSLLTVPSIEIHFAGGIRDAPFHREPLWDARPEGGVWYSDSGSYRLARVDSTGTLTCTVVVRGIRRPVSGSDRKAYLSAADRAETDREVQRTIRRRRAEMPIPDHRPILRDLVVAEDGRVWVKPTPEESAFAGSEIWHVFRPDGEPVGRVRLPPRLRIHEVVGDLVYGTIRDETDVQHVVRYRLTER